MIQQVWCYYPHLPAPDCFISRVQFMHVHTLHEFMFVLSVIFGVEALFSMNLKQACRAEFDYLHQAVIIHSMITSKTLVLYPCTNRTDREVFVQLCHKTAAVKPTVGLRNISAAMQLAFVHNVLIFWISIDNIWTWVSRSETKPRACNSEPAVCNCDVWQSSEI